MIPKPTMTAEERDQADEDRYTWRGVYSEDAHLSTPAYVSLHRDQLALAFFDALKDMPSQQGPPGPLQDSLYTWEVMRFGATLCDAAHQMLWFAVRRLYKHGKLDTFWPTEGMRLDMEKITHYHPQRPDEKPSEYVVRIGVLGGLMEPPPKSTVLAKAIDGEEQRLPYKDPPEGKPAWAHPADAPDAEKEPPPPQKVIEFAETLAAEGPEEFVPTDEDVDWL